MCIAACKTFLVVFILVEFFYVLTFLYFKTIIVRIVKTRGQCTMILKQARTLKLVQEVTLFYLHHDVRQSPAQCLHYFAFYERFYHVLGVFFNCPTFLTFTERFWMFS